MKTISIILLFVCLIILCVSIYLLLKTLKLAKLADQRCLELFEKYRKERENAGS